LKSDTYIAHIEPL